jgi:hypothetical protein
MKNIFITKILYVQAWPLNTIFLKPSRKKMKFKQKSVLDKTIY